MQEWPLAIDYDFHKAEARRLRTAAVDRLFRRVAHVIPFRRVAKGAPRQTPAFRAPPTTTPMPG